MYYFWKTIGNGCYRDLKKKKKVCLDFFLLYCCGVLALWFLLKWNVSSLFSLGLTWIVKGWDFSLVPYLGCISSGPSFN